MKTKKHSIKMNLLKISLPLSLLLTTIFFFLPLAINQESGFFNFYKDLIYNFIGNFGSTIKEQAMNNQALTMGSIAGVGVLITLILSLPVIISRKRSLWFTSISIAIGLLLVLNIFNIIEIIKSKPSAAVDYIGLLLFAPLLLLVTTFEFAFMNIIRLKHSIKEKVQKHKKPKKHKETVSKKEFIQSKDELLSKTTALKELMDKENTKNVDIPRKEPIQPSVKESEHFAPAPTTELKENTVIEDKQTNTNLDNYKGTYLRTISVKRAELEAEERAANEEISKHTSFSNPSSKNLETKPKEKKNFYSKFGNSQTQVENNDKDTIRIKRKDIVKAPFSKIKGIILPSGAKKTAGDIERINNQISRFDEVYKDWKNPKAKVDDSFANKIYSSDVDKIWSATVALRNSDKKEKPATQIADNHGFKFNETTYKNPELENINSITNNEKDNNKFNFEQEEKTLSELNHDYELTQEHNFDEEL